MGKRGLKPKIEKLSEAALWRTRLCDLDLSLEHSPLAPLIRRVVRELRRKDILFTPYFWISDEWFCPDGYSGVAVPFFLLHPRLKRLERSQMGFVDGKSEVEILKILRHEVGHALENAFGLKRHPLRRSVFGSSQTPYPVSYRPQPYSRFYVRHLGWGYGQSHPDEDFAETFAVWLDPASDWRRKYKGRPALEKLKAVDRLMKEIKGVATYRGQRGRYEDLSTKRLSLAEYYRKKRLHFRLPTRQKLVGEVVQLPKRPKASVSLSQYLKQNENVLIHEVSEALGQPRHLIRRVLSDFIRQGRNQKISQQDRRALKSRSLNWVTEGSLIYLEKGLDRVVL